MRALQAHGILTKMTDIVLNYLNEEKLEVRENSFFGEELKDILIPKRRDLFRTYLCDSTFLLLQGVIDQVHSLDSTLRVRTPAVFAISPFILMRTLLEYSAKLTYLTDPHSNERIQRTLKCLFADIQEFRKLPQDLTSPAGRKRADDQADLATEWYSELTGGKEKLRPVSALEIFEELAGDPSDEWEQHDWVEDGRGHLVPFSYSKGYRIYSAIAHGNSWAVQHYGVTKIHSDVGETVTLPGLDAKTVHNLQILAGRQLVSSLGFAVQFMRGTIPAGAMNKMEALIALILRAPMNEMDASSIYGEKSS